MSDLLSGLRESILLDVGYLRRDVKATIDSLAAQAIEEANNVGREYDSGDAGTANDAPVV